MVRSAVVAVCVAGSVGGTAGYAAESPTLSLAVTPSMVLATSEQGLVEGQFRLTPAPSQETLRDIAVVIDVSGLDGVAQVTTSSWNVPCAASGDTVTCFGDDDNFDIHDGRLDIGLFHLRGVDGASPGTRVSLPVTVTTDNFPAVSATVEVTKAEAVDLGNGEAYPIWVKRGELRGINVSVRNTGDTAVNGTVLVMAIPWQLRMERRFRNCSYGEWVAVCRFGSELTPHSVYEVTGTLAFTVQNYAVAPSQTTVYTSWYTVDTFQETVLPDLPTLTPGTGAALELVEIRMAAQAPQHDTNWQNDLGAYDIFITGNNPVDLAAVGDTVTGAQGDTADLRVGLRNAGGAFADNEDSDEPSAYAEVRLPEGLSVVGDVPCDRGEDNDLYRCALTVDSMPGDRHIWTFRVRVDNRITDAAGSVSVVNGTVRDGVAGNNTAAILANPSPTPSGSASASASPGASVSVSPSGPAGPGKMPITGSPLGLLVMAGLLALGAGSLLYVAAARRRRGVPGKPVAE